ncbi:MAG: sugar phosphate isomerase/epimerase [Desulfobacterales bacterium]|nr:sugar phosphate isomerase/epimerase [Desulfobacterales bacterium]
MKLSVVIAGADAPPSAFVVWRGFEESIQKASDFGYHGVELALKSADDIDPEKLSRWLSANRMEVSAISTGLVFAESNLYFTHPDPAARRRVIEVFTGLIYLAKNFGRLINVGRARGFIGAGQKAAEAEILFLETMQQLCDIAAKDAVTIVVEPVNRYEINFINSSEDGAELIKKVKRPNTGLMPDVFHMNIEDAKIGATLARLGSQIKYVHLADSNRHAPGQGHLDFDNVFDGLKKAGFKGWAAIEILPLPDADTAARQAADYILPLIEKYNFN